MLTTGVGGNRHDVTLAGSEHGLKREREREELMCQHRMTSQRQAQKRREEVATYVGVGVVDDPLTGGQVLVVLEPPVQVGLTDDADHAGEAHGDDEQDNDHLEGGGPGGGLEERVGAELVELDDHGRVVERGQDRLGLLEALVGREDGRGRGELVPPALDAAAVAVEQTHEAEADDGRGTEHVDVDDLDVVLGPRLQKEEIGEGEEREVAQIPLPV